MADKPTTTDVGANAQYNASVLNDNFAVLEDAIEGCLGRGGTSESPNSMAGDLDMDNNRIQNLAAGVSPTDAARIADLTSFTVNTGSADIAVGFLVNLRAIDTTNLADNTTAGVAHRTTVGDSGGGLFYWDSSDNSANVAADTQLGIYVSPSNDFTGASGAWIRQRSSQIVSPEWFGAIGDGTTDDTNIFEVILSDTNVSGIDLGDKTYLVSTNGVTLTKDLYARNGGGFKLTVGTANTLFADFSDYITVDGVNVDASNDTGIARIYGISENTVAPVIKNLTIRNMSSDTFVRAIDISDNGVENFIVDNVSGVDLSATANGVQGDILGSCRLIQINAETTPTTNPSWGAIRNIYAENLQTREDADAIQVQSNGTLNMAINIDNIRCVDVTKRAVKVQANGIRVSNVDHDTRGLTVDGSYAAVSLYGDYGTAENIYTNGKTDVGVDMSGTSNRAVNVVNIIDSAHTVVASSAVKVSSGSATIRNIRGENVQNVLKVRTEIGDIDEVFASGIYGSASDEILLCSLDASTAFDISLVNISNIAGETLDASHRAVYCYAEAGSTGTLGTINLDCVDVTCNGYFTCVEASAWGETSLSNITTSGATSDGVAVQSADGLDAARISCRDASTQSAISVISCTNSVISRVQAKGSRGVSIGGGDDIIVDGVYVPAGATPVLQYSTPTNIQTANTFNFAT